MPWSPPAHDATRELRDQQSPQEWAQAVRDIARRHGLDSSTATPFESGSDVVWAVGTKGDHVVKLTAPCWTGEIVHEVECLQRVSGRLSVKTPELRAHGELAGWPYVVMSRVAGRALAEVWPGLDAQARADLAGRLGQLTRELHGLEVESEPDDWIAFRTECRQRAIERDATDGAPVHLCDAIADFLRSIRALDDPTRVFLHTELLDQHIFVEERRGQCVPSALIDFADARVGPPAYDFPALVEFIFRGEAGLLRAFLLGYGYDPGDLKPARSEEFLAWGLFHRFGRLKRMLAAVAPSSPESLPALARALYRVD